MTRSPVAVLECAWFHVGLCPPGQGKPCATSVLLAPWCCHGKVLREAECCPRSCEMHDGSQLIGMGWQ